MQPRVRNVLLTGACLVAVGGIATAWATGSVAASARYNTAIAAIGDVAQSYQATGTISRNNVVDAEFGESGTVKKINVAVGDAVEKGDVLATLDTTALKLALLNAETDLAGAKANLYAAEHPSAGSSGAGSSGLPSGGSGSGGSGSGGSGSGGSGSGGSGSGGSVPGGISAADAAKLYGAIAAVNVATQNWSNPEQPTTCDAIYTALLNANTDEPEPTPTTSPTEPTTEPTPTPTPTPTPEPTTEPTPTPTPTPDPTPTPSPTEATTEPTTTPTTEPTGDSGDVKQLALVVEDITIEDIKACGQARTDLLMANAVLADYYQQLITTGTIDDGTGSPGGSPDGGSPGTGGSTGGSVTIPSGGSQSGSGSSSPKTSARSVASAEADVLKATQAVESAEAALRNAELVAPLSGTVGALSLSVGDAASAGAVTIVGEGTATVTLEVPLATRTLLCQGMPATVSPAGSLDSLPATIGWISILETEGTAGDNPTYTTEVVVEDPDMLLKEGARAGVEITTRTASGVVTVPVSAVTPTGTGTGTVQIVDNATAETAQVVEVTTGAVGGGRIEIAAGLEEGQIVVLSDKTAALPAGNVAQVRRQTTGGR